MNIYEIVGSLIVGIVSGIFSSSVVYFCTKRKEDDYNTYYYLRNYLCRTMERLEIEMPSELLHYAARVGNSESTWGIAVNEAINLTSQYELTDRELSDDEEKLAENILIALKELDKWGKEKHILNDRKYNYNSKKYN